MVIDKIKKRFRKKLSIRQNLRGTSQRPRLSVFKSSSNIYAQIINDDNHKTICSASTLEKELRETKFHHCNIEYAKKVGKLLAQRAKKNNITTIVFDRNGYKYHGKVKALADACREEGLIF